MCAKAAYPKKTVSLANLTLMEQKNMAAKLELSPSLSLSLCFSYHASCENARRVDAFDDNG
jgi:hypothetical protein